jgi:spore maturation protein CgeB
MGFFAKNLTLLRRNQPALAHEVHKRRDAGRICVDSAANGEATLKVRGCALHSFRDPGKEGDNWARHAFEEHDLSEGGRATVLGFGLGYHLRGLAARGVCGTVIEPELDTFMAAMENLDLTDVLGNFRVLAGLSAERVRRSHGEELVRTILPHPPSLRLHPAALGRLHSYGEALKEVRRGGMKILLVNPISGGSLPIARYCASALRQMGHVVTTFASEAFSTGMDFSANFRFERCRKAFRNELVSSISRSVELMAKECRPDMVLALAQAPLLPDTLDRLAAMEVPAAFWFVEDYRVLTYWRDVAPHYGYFFGIQKEECQNALAGVGVANYSYLPVAASPEVHAPVDLSREDLERFGSPVSFVGAGYHNRCTLFRGLADYPFKIWGSDWPLTPPLDRLIQMNAARIDTESCVRIFNASAVNINLHSSLSHEGVDPAGDFVNPRTFEIASCGAFQLVDRRALLGELFAEGEIELFGDLCELRDKIDHYLDRPQERCRLAQSGRERVLREHTYVRRMEELLAVMLADLPAMAEKLRSRMDEKERLRQGIASQEGLKDLMDRLPHAPSPTLADIYGALREGEGSLTRAEKIFLVLKNVELKLD